MIIIVKPAQLWYHNYDIAPSWRILDFLLQLLIFAENVINEDGVDFKNIFL